MLPYICDWFYTRYTEDLLQSQGNPQFVLLSHVGFWLTYQHLSHNTKKNLLDFYYMPYKTYILHEMLILYAIKMLKYLVTYVIT